MGLFVRLFGPDQRRPLRKDDFLQFLLDVNAGLLALEFEFYDWQARCRWQVHLVL
jgi:hypothetical protein